MRTIKLIVRSVRGCDYWLGDVIKFSNPKLSPRQTGDRNIYTKHIPTLVALYLQALTK